jgi:TetR/AcrR family transcriptional regulator, repressor for uid operon
MGETTDATRQALVAAAAEVFAEKGYERAGVAEIARRAGLTTGAIYSNFSGKAELLLETIDVRAEDEFEQLFNEHRFQGRATDILQTVGAHLVSSSGNATDSHLLLEAITTARRDPEVAAMLATRIEARAARMAALIEEAKLDGTIAEELDTLALVRFCHAVSLGMLNLKALALDLPEPQPWGDLIAQLVGALAPSTVDLTNQGALTHDRD